MRLAIKEVPTDEMPDEHEWATVVIGDETWLLVRQLDEATVNAALAEVDCA